MPPPHSGTEKTLKRNLLFKGYSGAICLSNSGLLIQKLHLGEMREHLTLSVRQQALAGFTSNCRFQYLVELVVL